LTRLSHLFFSSNRFKLRGEVGADVVFCVSKMNYLLSKTDQTAHSSVGKMKREFTATIAQFLNIVKDDHAYTEP